MTDRLASPSSAPFPPTLPQWARCAPAAASRRERSCHRTPSSTPDPSSGRYVLDWIHSHLSAKEPIVATSCLYDALTSRTGILSVDDHGVEVSRLVDKILTALPERDIIRKTELVQAMEKWKRGRPVRNTARGTADAARVTRADPRPMRVMTRRRPEPVTRVWHASHDECDLDAETQVFHSPFLAAS